MSLIYPDFRFDYHEYCNFGNEVVKKQVPTVPFSSIKVKHALVMPDQLCTLQSAKNGLCDKKQIIS